MSEAKNDDFTPIWGAAAIGREIGKSERQAFNMLEAGQLPARKVGGRWVAERGKLRAYICGESAAA